MHFLTRCPLLVLTLALCSGTHAGPLDDARNHMEAGKLRSAEIGLKGILQADPDNAQARMLLGELLLKANQGEAALHQLETAQRLGIPRTKLLLPLGRAYLLKGETQRVIDEFQVTEDTPRDLTDDLLVLRGYALLVQKDPRAAETAFRQAMAMSTDSVEARYGLAQILLGESQRRDAVRLVQEALEIDPKSEEGWALLANVELQNRDLAATGQALDHVIEINPENWGARIARAHVLLDLGEPDKAARDIDALAETGSNSPSLTLLRGRMSFARGQLQEGVDHLERYLSAVPDDPRVIYLTTTGLLQLGRLEQAEDYVSRLRIGAPESADVAALAASIALIKKDAAQAVAIITPFSGPGASPQVDQVYARALIAEGRLDDAVGVLNRRIAANDDAWDFRLLRLKLFAAQNAWQELRTEAQAMLTKRPDETAVRTLLISAMTHLDDVDSALMAARTAAEDNPKDPAARIILGAVLGLSGDPEGARAAYREALALKPDAEGAALGLAQLEATAGDFVGAREILEQFAETNPENLRAVIGLAGLDQQAGDVGGAAQWLKQALGKNPENLELRLRVAAALNQNGDQQGALDLLQQAPVAQAEEPRLLRARGGLELDAGQSAQALATLERLNEMQPRATETVLMLALARARAGRFDGLDTLMSDALTQSGDTPLLSLILPAVFDELPDVPSRQRFLNALGAVVPDNPSLRFLKARLALHARDTEGAAEHLLVAHEGAPNNRRVFLALVQVLAKGGNQVRAIELSAEWLERHPDDVDVRMGSAMASLGSGNEAAAIDQYRAVLKTDPKHSDAMNNLAMLRLEQDPVEALALARAARAIKPADPLYADTLGAALLANGMAPEAVDVLQTAHSAVPSNPTVSYRYAQALAQDGQPDQARRVLLEIGQTGFPERDQADALLTRLGGAEGGR